MRGNRDGWTLAYLRDRERVLGRRWQLSHDPEIAAEQLAEQAGGRERAEHWVIDVLSALLRDRGRAA